jgi:hypothetical protein
MISPKVVVLYFSYFVWFIQKSIHQHNQNLGRYNYTKAIIYDARFIADCPHRTHAVKNGLGKRRNGSLIGNRA